MFFTAEIQPSVIAMFWKRIPKPPQAVLVAELNEGSAARHCSGSGGTGCSMLLIPWRLQGQWPAFEPTSVLGSLGKAKHGGAGGLTPWG